MKKAILIGLFGLFISTMSCAQKSEEIAIKNVIIAFSKAGDANDAQKLSAYLDDNYRIVMNRLFGSKEVSVMSKSAYLEKIKTKEFGGDKRTVTIQNSIINGTSAVVKVAFKGAKMTFVSLITLIKKENGTWILVSDVPVVG